MTTTLSAKGQVVIPRDIRAKWGLKQGHDFLVLCSSTGEILLRPIKRPGKSWVKALRKLHGLKLDRVDEGRTFSVLDSMIEATALHWDLTIITRNVSDFIEVPTLNPWKRQS